MELLQWRSPIALIEVECSKGTYIRTLAHELGEKTGCGGHLKSLIRIRSGPFHINEAVTFARAETAFREGQWTSIVHPMDSAVLHLPHMKVDEEEERVVSNGCMIDRKIEGAVAGDLCRVYSSDGRFIAVMLYDEMRKGWQPRKVFTTRHVKS